VVLHADMRTVLVADMARKSLTGVCMMELSFVLKEKRELEFASLNLEIAPLSNIPSSPACQDTHLFSSHTPEKTKLVMKFCDL